MKTVISAALAALIAAAPALANPTFGGGMTIKVYSTKGSGTLKDTTAHTTLKNGSTVSTSTDNNDGQTPNGGAGEASEGGGEEAGDGE